MSAHTGPVDSPTSIFYFRGKWTKLGNYSSCTVFYDDHAYPTVEHAYQAQKSLDPAIQKMIRHASGPAAAKAIARKVLLRPDWEAIKEGLMLTLLREKFQQEPERSILLSTGNKTLIEGNWWRDTYWGQCPLGNGQNRLGELLMQIRKELVEGRL
jgi:hypothetical protein